MFAFTPKMLSSLVHNDISHTGCLQCGQSTSSIIARLQLQATGVYAMSKWWRILQLHISSNI